MLIEEAHNLRTGATQEGAKKNWLIMAFLFAAYFLSYFDRLLMVVLAETIKEEFSLSDKELSVLTGAAFIVVYGVGGIFIGWLVDRFSRKNILVGALAIWSLATMACGLAHSYLQLVVARIAVGIGEAASVPVGLSIIGDQYSPKKRPMATAVFYSGGMVGVFASFVLGSWIAQNYGWRVAFLIAAPPGLLLASAMIFALKEPVRESSIHASGESDVRSFNLVIANKPLVWLLAAGALATFTNVGMMQWLPIFFIRSHGMDLREIGIFFGPVMAGGMGIGVLLGGWLGNRLATDSAIRLVQFCAVALFVLGPLYILVFLTASLAFAMVLTFLASSLALVYSPCYVAASMTICDPRTRGTVAGLGSFINNILGGALCTFSVGALSDWLAPTSGSESLRHALIIATLVFCLVASILFVITARQIRNRVQ